MTFEDMGLSPRIVSRLAEIGLTDPTPIQAGAIPPAMQGHDVLGLAQTGTGKTAAFGLPLIEALSATAGKARPRGADALILAPTRELARQIADNLDAYAGGGHLRVTLVVGGAGIVGQAKRLERGTHILVATPGRLIDHLDRGTVRLDQTRFLVLDEADQMLDMGFIHALRRIAPLLPAQRQTMLFSATMPKQMEELAGTYLTDPRRVQVAPPGKAADKIDQALHYVAKSDKPALLRRLLARHPGERAIVFGRTKHGSEKLCRQLVADGFAAVSIHGNKSQNQRDRALAAFKAAQATVLVATDVAARGLDIPDVRFVYNYDLPDVPENYVHRIGRTARAGNDGAAVALVSEEEMGELRAIQKILKTEIAVAGGTAWQRHEEVKPKRGNRGGGGGRPQGGGGRPGGGKPAGPGRPGAKPTGRKPRRRRAA
ncbi:MAG: DEAD/DEAH box helicase [Paracoccaceae bacterium]